MSAQNSAERPDAVVAVVDCAPGDRERMGRLEAAVPTRFAFGPPDAEQIVERAQGAAVLATLYTYTRVGADVLERLPDLRAVMTRTAGYSHIDLDAAQRAGIVVGHVPTAPSLAVAEYTLAAMLAMSRQLVPAIESARAGEWSFTGHRGHDLSGRTLGVVGLGAIGARVAALGQAFGMRAIGWSRTAKQLPGVEQLPLEQVLARADVVSVNVALTAETEGLLDRERLDALRPGAYLINTARGEVVDLEAVCDLLRSGRLAGACLDVLGDEPVAPERLAPLAGVPSLLITPHVSWHTEGTLQRQFEGLTDKIIAFCEGRAIEAVPATRTAS